MRIALLWNTPDATMWLLARALASKEFLTDLPELILVRWPSGTSLPSWERMANLAVAVVQPELKRTLALTTRAPHVEVSLSEAAEALYRRFRLRHFEDLWVVGGAEIGTVLERLHDKDKQEEGREMEQVEGVFGRRLGSFSVSVRLVGEIVQRVLSKHRQAPGRLAVGLESGEKVDLESWVRNESVVNWMRSTAKVSTVDGPVPRRSRIQADPELPITHLTSWGTGWEVYPACECRREFLLSLGPCDSGQDATETALGLRIEDLKKLQPKIIWGALVQFRQSEGAQNSMHRLHKRRMALPPEDIWGRAVKPPSTESPGFNELTLKDALELMAGRVCEEHCFFYITGRLPCSQDEAASVAQ